MHLTSMPWSNYTFRYEGIVKVFLIYNKKSYGVLLHCIILIIIPKNTTFGVLGFWGFGVLGG